MARGIVYYRTSVIFSAFLQLSWSSLGTSGPVRCRHAARPVTATRSVLAVRPASPDTGRAGPRGGTPAVIERTTLDFWDITKLLVRRWQVALPMLVLSAV